jgi:hypothetical protein
MTLEEHKAYVDRIAEIEDKFKAMEIKDFTLTEQEAEAIQNLPEDVGELHASLLSRYKPFSENADFRDTGWTKFIALVMVNRPLFEDAYNIGTEAGRG